MFLRGIWILIYLFLAALLTYSTQGYPQRFGRKQWVKSYAKLTGQIWFSITKGRRDGALYCSGKLEDAHGSSVLCLDANKKDSQEENENRYANGVICKLNPRNGKEKWCARTCEEGVPLLSVVTSGKKVVYAAGLTNSKDTVLYTIEKKNGRQKMQVLVPGQVFKMDHNPDGIYVCGSGIDKKGRSGMMIARITEEGSIKWHKIVRDRGLDNCLSTSALKEGSSAYVVGVMNGGSDNTSMYVMKMDRETGETEWTKELTDRNYVLTSGDIMAKKGVYVTALEADPKGKRTNVVVHKLGEGTGILLWSKVGKHADRVHGLSLFGKSGLVYASYNSSGVRISSTSPSSTDRLLGDAEHEKETWVQPQEAIISEVVDTALGRGQAAILWRNSEGGNLIQMVSFDGIRGAGRTGGVITRVKTKLKLDLPTTAEATVKAGICDILGDAMQGKARIENDGLMVTGTVSKFEAEMVIRKTMEDRDNDGRSYVETRLGIGKRSVLLEGELMTTEARDVHDRPTRRERKRVTLSGQVNETGGRRSVVAEASESKWWTWWKILIAAVGGIGVMVAIWLVVRRL